MFWVELQRSLTCVFPAIGKLGRYLTDFDKVFVVKKFKGSKFSSELNFVYLYGLWLFTNSIADLNLFYFSENVIISQMEAKLFFL